VQVDQTNVTSKEGAALKAWALVNDLYSAKNVTGEGASVAAQVTMGALVLLLLLYDSQA